MIGYFGIVCFYANFEAELKLAILYCYTYLLLNLCLKTPALDKRRALACVSQ